MDPSPSAGLKALQPVASLQYTTQKDNIKMSALSQEAAIEALRQRASEIIHRASTGGPPAQMAETENYNNCIHDFIAAGGSTHDVLVKIGESVFGTVLPGGLNDKRHQGPYEDEPVEGSVRLPFDYLEQFMLDSFLSIGVPEPEARICADVLIEADKRGIDSHGVGRLKPIYFDRIKKNILRPFMPITVVKETATTALIDGHLGLGLYVGPHCMKLAIQKAKQYGVGFVVAQVQLLPLNTNIVLTRWVYRTPPITVLLVTIQPWRRMLTALASPAPMRGPVSRLPLACSRAWEPTR